MVFRMRFWKATGSFIVVVDDTCGVLGPRVGDGVAGILVCVFDNMDTGSN